MILTDCLKDPDSQGPKASNKAVEFSPDEEERQVVDLPDCSNLVDDPLKLGRRPG